MKISWNDIKQLKRPFAMDIILYIYWFSLVITVGSGLYSMVEEGFTFFAFLRGLFVIFFGIVMCRFMAEAAQVLFRIEKHLSVLADQTRAPDSTVNNAAEDADSDASKGDSNDTADRSA